MKFIVKKFEELTTFELYEILKLRSRVFVLEQECIYQDIDDIDLSSYHLYFEEDGKIISYLRIFKKEKDINTYQIGRVLSLKRRQKIAHKLLQRAISLIKTFEDGKKIYLESQAYVVDLYKNLGFKIISDEFLEDGISHFKMQLEIDSNKKND